MHKQDEIAYYSRLRSIGRHPTRAACQGIADELGIHHKRAFGLLMKWAGRGWWDYGTWAWGGWFTPEAPNAIEAHEMQRAEMC